MSMLAVLVSASAAVAATAVVRFAWFAGLGELALEVFQAHCRVYVWWWFGGVGVNGVVAMDDDAQELK